jgi:hypothetical protein
VSAYISVELQRQVRSHFRDCCAYCRTAEALTVAIFEFEHIVPRSAGGVLTLANSIQFRMLAKIESFKILKSNQTALLIFYFE